MHGRKASEIFLEYVQPYLVLCFDPEYEQSIKKIEQGLKTPWMIWNACVMAESPNEKIDFLLSIRLLLNNQPEPMKELTEFLIARKKRLFHEYQYLLGDFKLSFDKKAGEIRLAIESKKPT